MTDQNLNFCTPSVWEPIIKQSQQLLFDTDYLINWGNDFRNQYINELENIKYPTVDIKKCNFDQAQQLNSVYAGYDLPTTFTPDNWNNEFIAIVAQDPLRTPSKEDNGPEFTIATPWGFNSHKAHNYKHNKKLWPSVVAICGAGYGVYLTDASKLYFHPLNGIKSEITKVLEDKTFALEMGAVDPIHTVVFGTKARDSMIKMGKDTFDYHVHLAYWAGQKKFYRVPNGNYTTIAIAIKKQISEKSGIKF